MKNGLKLFLIVLFFVSSCTTFRPNDVFNDHEFPLVQKFSLKVVNIQRVAFSDSWVVIQTPGTIRALDLGTKQYLWTLEPISSDYASEFLIVDEQLIFSSQNQIYIINKLGNKRSINLIPTRKQLIKIVAIQNNILYVIRGGEWTLEAYDFLQNKFLWETWVGRGQTDTFNDPISNITYVTDPRSIRAIDNTNGQILFDLARKILHSTYENNTIYVLEKNNNEKTRKLIAIDTYTQKELWDVTIPAESEAEIYQITVVDDLLIASTRKGMFAVDKNTGAEKWRSILDDIFYTKPILYNDSLYARGSNQIIYAISKGTGEVVGIMNLGREATIKSGFESITGIYKIFNSIATYSKNEILIYHSK